MKNKVIYYHGEDYVMYKLVKRKSAERRRVLYVAGGRGFHTLWHVLKEGMSATEAEAFIKLLGLRLYRRS